VARRLAGVTPFRTCCFTGGNSRSLKSQASMLQEGIDVLIATPGRISTLLEDGALSLEDCRAVVLDEVTLAAAALQCVLLPALVLPIYQ
jgi:superfamily II DNA/RNA helicase